jgi:hypothetical protein
MIKMYVCYKILIVVVFTVISCGFFHQIMRLHNQNSIRELINVIRGIIESKEEYKKLPPPTGSYL